MGTKRALTPDPEATTSGTTSATDGEAKKRRKDKKKKRDKVVVPAEEEEIEEGEVDTNADLFMIDLEPMVIPVGIAFEEVVEVVEEVVAPVVAVKTQKQKQEEEAALMKAFKEEVAMDDDSGMDDDDDDVEEESEDEVETMIIHENPETLEKAIKGKITDDSAAKVTGRYYKEDDLTRSCGMCGEQGHSSRDCTHSQCFTCGLVNGGHESRNCPVSLVCSSCGSRGHYARECTVPASARSSYSKCGTCNSSLHITSNCPSLWRVYDTTGTKPKLKAKIHYACGNDGSTGDHFIDDCLLPRQHPMRYADPSAFNRSALGASGSAPSGSQFQPASATSRRFNMVGEGAASGRGRGGERGSGYDDTPDDDDWFASRGSASRGPEPSSSRGGRGSTPSTRGGSSSGKKEYRGGRFAASGAVKRKADRYDSPASSVGTPGRSGGRDNKQHIQFSGASQERFGGSPAPRGGRNGGGGGRYEDQQLDYGRGGNEGGSGRKKGGKGGGGGSLASRLGGQQDGGSGGRQGGQRYHGGYA